MQAVILPEAEIQKMEKVSLELQPGIAKKDPLCAKAIAGLREIMETEGR